MTPRTVLVSLSSVGAGTVPVGAASSINANDPASLRQIHEISRQFIRSGDSAKIAAAEAMLREAVRHADPSGETHQLLGLAQFLQKKYGDAVASLEIAVSANPRVADWKTLLERATRNAATRLDLSPEPTDLFDPIALTAPPAKYLREPQGIERPEDPGPVTGLVGTLRDVAGGVFGPVLGAVVAFESRRGVEATWKEWPTLKGPLADLRRDVKIAGIRKWMNTTTLKSTEAPGTLVNSQQPGQKRPEWTSYIRTANGSWNTDDPAEGMAGTRVSWQGRDPVAAVRRDRSLDADLPSVRELSRMFLAAPDGVRTKAPFLNNLTIAWIQFMLHDWINHRQQALSTAEWIKVDLAEDDPFRARYGQDALTFPRTQPDPLPTPGMLTYRNEVTAWWDGSQIYGSDQATQDRVRTGADGSLMAEGKVRLDEGLLPIDERGRQLSGFTRNWWVGLSMFHTLFVLHHNYICDVLKQKYPRWSSDQLFNKARLINSAIMAKIHTIEWTPAVLPTKTLAVGMNANWNGLIGAVTRRFKDRAALNGFDVTDPVLGGLVGGRREGYGVPYNFGEQFPEVYRLHSAVPQELEIRRIGSTEVVAKVEVDASREQAAQKIQRQYGMPTLINSLGFEKMAALVNNNYPRFMTELSTEGSPVMDLGAADLLRARERGVPPYNEFRKQLGLPKIEKFEDLGVDAETVAKLKQCYGDGPEGVERLDLLVGTTCERDRPLMGFGQTLFAVFLQAASGRLERDPWFCKERFNDRYYTREGMDLIDSANFKDVLLLHYPELKKSGLMGVNNAFEPWSSSAATAPDEHPLTSTGAEKGYLSGVPPKAGRDLPLRMYDRVTNTHVIVAGGKVFADLDGDGRIGQTEEHGLERRPALLEAARHIHTLFDSRVPGIPGPDGLVVSNGALNAVEQREFESGRGTMMTRSALVEHLAYFDRDGDGRIRLGENYRSWRRLGFGILKALKLTVGSAIVFGGRPGNGFSIGLASIDRWRPAGSTRIYDKDGRVDEARLGEFCRGFETVAVDGVLTHDQARSVIQGKVSLGSVPRRQFESLYTLSEKMNDGKTITVDQIRWLYDGSLLWRAASMADTRGHRAL